MSRPPGSDVRRAPDIAGKGNTESWLPHDLLETIPDALVAVNPEGVIVQVNSQAESLFGYSHEQLIGQKIELLVPERFRGGHQQHRSDFAEQPKIRRMGAGLDLYGVRRDGSEFPVEISLSPIDTPQGRLVLSAIRDISDRKKIEEELRRAHAELSRSSSRQLWDYSTRLAAIIDSSQDAIIGKDLDGIITSWNKGAERIYGYSAEEIVGKPISILISKDNPDDIPAILDRIRHGQAIDHYETLRVTKDGKPVNVSLSVSPIRDNEGKIVGASAIGRDVTAHKRAEAMLRQAQKMEAVGRLAGGVAHDFNNILGIITACAELLRDRINEGPDTTLYVDNIQKAAERGANLTRQLLAFSRQQVIQPRVLDLNERLKDILKLLRPLMGDDVEIVVLPRQASGLIEVDPSQLDQIVLNLAVNARDAMPRGGKLIVETNTMVFDQAFVEQHPPMIAGKYVLLAISDTGTGMDEATVTRIFEPFFTTKEMGKGTGLGLATVYGIVRQNGGYIWVYSEPKRGTTFKIYLPCMEHKIGLPLESTITSVPAKRQGTTILLVEDDDMMRDLTRQMLERHGYSVLEAKDGASALTLASAEGTIDVMLTDVVMRGISGPELAVQLSSSRPGMRVVFMSGYTGELIAEHDAVHSGIPLLEKPFTRAALLRAIDSAFEGAN